MSATQQGVPAPAAGAGGAARPEVGIRGAYRDEVPALIAMLADDALGSGRETVTDPLPPAYYAAFASITADPRQRLLVADLGGEPVGMLQLTFIPGLSRRGSERAILEGVRVRSDVRGLGIGRQLVTAAIEQARVFGCTLVQLTSDRSRTDAQRFYSSLGFAASHVGMKLQLDGG
jgi:GNAT superfamily N-acetyltransferase